MESKVKIWGKEINICGECLHFSYNDCGICDCNMLYKEFELELDPNKNVSKYCPFLQPISKEVIESYGFKYIKTHPGTTESYFEFPDSEWGLDFDPNWKGILYIRIYVFGCDGDTTYFAGTINNPIELEFILKSVGVIE